MTSSLSESNLRMLPIFRIGLNIQNCGTLRISFESPRRDESDYVITFHIEPPDVADFSYLLKYSKWRHVTHIIRKPLPSWVWWRHHFPNRTFGCRRFFVSDQIFKMAARDAFESLRRAESDDVITFLVAPSDTDELTAAFESLRRAESDDVITFLVAPSDVSDELTAADEQPTAYERLERRALRAKSA